jgi:hypothetical protein
MALTNIPVIWAAQVLAKLRYTIVYGAPNVTNRNYQGEISQGGDRVRVTGLVDPTIFDITPNVDIPAPETLTDTQADLVIDQNKGFNFQVDDLNELQHAIGHQLELQSASNAARRLAEVADASIGAQMVLDAQSANKIGSDTTPITIDAPQPGATLTAGSIDTYRLLTRLAVILDKNNVPRDQRWVVLPPFMMGALSLDQRFTASVADQGRTLANGFQGRAAGFNVYTTTAIPVGNASTKYKVVAGSPLATSYAEQLVNVVQYRPERRFADAMKGQHVYGYKTFYPQALAVATVTDVSGLDS